MNMFESEKKSMMIFLKFAFAVASVPSRIITNYFAAQVLFWGALQDFLNKNPKLLEESLTLDIFLLFMSIKDTSMDFLIQEFEMKIIIDFLRIGNILSIGNFFFLLSLQTRWTTVAKYLHTIDTHYLK